MAERANPAPILAAIASKQKDYLAIAERHLEAADGKSAWENTNQYMTAGRRPTKKFPRIFISAHELAHVLEDYEQAGIPLDRVKSAMILVDSKLASYEISSKSTASVCVFAWLVSWVKHQLLETLIKEKRLQRVSKW